MSDTAIEWTEKTWNPTTGCDKVSAGCDHCYALTLAKRLKGMGSAKYQNDGDPRTSGPGFALTMHDDALGIPATWRQPKRVFVNSMSDLFHPKVTDEFLTRVFDVMGALPRHTFQVLTKRAPRMRSFVTRYYGAGKPLPNVWLGVSTEDQEQADRRIPALLETPAAVRWISAEPLLGPIDLTEVIGGLNALEKDWAGGPGGGTGAPHPLLNWVVVGGESGPGARPMHPDWARSLRDQCTAAGVPLLFKQWGAWVQTGHGIGNPTAKRVYVRAAQPDEHGCGLELTRVGKHAAGRQLDGRTWDEYPAVAS